MKKVNVSIVSMIAGIMLLATVIVLDIQDGIGFTLSMVGLFVLAAGIIANKKVREIVINLIINFF